MVARAAANQHWRVFWRVFWRAYVNDALNAGYKELFARLDLLAAPGFDCVIALGSDHRMTAHRGCLFG